MAVLPPGFVSIWTRWRIATMTRSAFTAVSYEIAAPPFTQANADTLLPDVAAAIDNIVASGATCDGGFALVGSDGGSIRYDVTLGTPVVGDRAGGVAPPQVAMLITKNTGLGGRRNRGRMFIPFPSEADIEANGRVESSALTVLQGVATALEATANGGVGRNNGDLVLLHDRAPTTPTTIVGLVASPLAATQRKRFDRSNV